MIGSKHIPNMWCNLTLSGLTTT